MDGPYRPFQLIGGRPPCNPEGPQQHQLECSRTYRFSRALVCRACIGVAHDERYGGQAVHVECTSNRWTEIDHSAAKGGDGACLVEHGRAAEWRQRHGRKRLEKHEQGCAAGSAAVSMGRADTVMNR
jgi:hypothetical protein